jgi:hypothetical protein
MKSKFCNTEIKLGCDEYYGTVRSRSIIAVEMLVVVKELA